MPNKKIKNIVIYKSIESGKDIIKSCIFYTDGSIYEGSYEDGIEAATKAAKENNITSKDALKEMINKKMFHVMSEKDFREQYNSFKPELNSSDIAEIITEKIKQQEELIKKEKEEKKERTIFEEVVEKENSKKDELKEPTPFYTVIEEVPYEEVMNNNTDEEEIVYQEEYPDSHYVEFASDSMEDEKEEEIIVENEDNFINNAGAKLKENHLGIKLLAVAAGVTILGASIIACNRKSKTGEIQETDLTDLTTTSTTIEETYEEPVEEVVERNNDLYDDYTFAELLEVTDDEFQRNSMINASAVLNTFNGTFADAYIEAGNDIRPALTFEEVVALQQAYNNYSMDEIRAYFNGYEVNAIDMSNAYKSASLQLMGAYIIEDSEHPVDMSLLIDSEEGRDFYNRYHELFLAAKTATGDEKLELVRQFYEMVREDFPITEEVRTEGISHADSHNSIEDYQLSVIPIIDAAERLFQNLEIDYTLGNESEDLSNYDFINDIGLCNHADDKFERIETIMLSSYEDNENPLYIQYRNAIINELMNNNHYYIDDSHRELANLRRFQIIINGEESVVSSSYSSTSGRSNSSSSSSSTGSSSTTETNSWEESSTSYSYGQEVIYGQIPYSEQLAIDTAIAQENAQAQAAAQAQANANAAAQQAQENANAQRVQDEVAQYNQQTQEQINNINSVINQNNSDTNTSNNTPINENNYSHVDFDNNHSDSNGNLDGSVQNVTTDGTGANQPLPDPNTTAFALNSSTSEYTQYGPIESYPRENDDAAWVELENVSREAVSTPSSSYTEWVDVDEGSAYIEYSDGYIPFDEDGNPIVIEETGYQYTR